MVDYSGQDLLQIIDVKYGMLKKVIKKHLIKTLGIENLTWYAGVFYCLSKSNCFLYLTADCGNGILVVKLGI